MLNYNGMILRKPNLHLTASAIAILLWQACLLAACSGNGAGQPHYRPTFVSAQHNKRELIFGTPSLAYFETTDLIMKYLSEHLDSIRIRTVACRSIEDYEDKLRKGYFDFTVINGAQLLSAEQNGYTVVGRIADDYRSFIFVNKDSAIENFRDCKGRSIALGANRILAGSVMPLMFLYAHGVDVNRDLKRVYCPSFESILLNVCLGKCAMGAVWETAYRNFQNKRPDLASRLRLKWMTPSLVSSGLLVRRNLDKALAQKLASLLFGLQADEQGRQALQRVGIGRIVAADSSSYIPLKEFLRKYDSLVH
jgi:phosphonate transport system substrate-binding protein